MEEIGLALPANSFFEKPMLLSVVEIYILDSDFESIRTHSNATIETIGHWLHAENPELFHELLSFSSGNSGNLK
jgi:hypothetical protein